MTARETPATARRRHKGHFDRGAAAVEMALVMPLLIAMIIGIIDFSRIFNGEIQLSQAAREGARVAALGTPGGFNAAAVRNRTEAALTNPALQGAATVTTTMRVVDSAGTTLVDSTGTPFVICTGSTGFAEVTVRIPYQKIWWGPVDLTQKAVMRCAG